MNKSLGPMANYSTGVVAVVCLLSLGGCTPSPATSHTATPSASREQSSQTPSTPSEPNNKVKQLGVKILKTHPFDRSAFTQGLEVDGDQLLVSTGWNGESRIYHQQLDGTQTQVQKIDDKYFGEGSTRYGDTVWQLTWQAGVAFKRDAQSLQLQDTVHYAGQGWGLCSYPDKMVMSDGTAHLRILNGDTFAEEDRIQVTKNGLTTKYLNELACTVEGGTRYVYSNVFMSTEIYKINLNSGHVEAVIDASTVPNRASDDPNSVLNGIANIPGTDRFYLTGKRWPDLFEVEFVEKPQTAK